MDELEDEESKYGSTVGQWEKAGLQEQKKIAWSSEPLKDHGSISSKDINVIHCLRGKGGGGGFGGGQRDGDQ